MPSSPALLAHPRFYNNSAGAWWVFEHAEQLAPIWGKSHGLEAMKNVELPVSALKISCLPSSDVIAWSNLPGGGANVQISHKHN
jgi:hypothetical protein